MATYRVTEAQTGEVRFEVYSESEFLEMGRTATKEQADGLVLTIIGRTGKEKVVDILAERDRLLEKEVAKFEKFHATHRAVYVQTGATHFAKPKVFYVKK